MKALSWHVGDLVKGSLSNGVAFRYCYGSSSRTPRRRTQQSSHADPSLKHIADPLNTPTVRKARECFANLPFEVFWGEVNHWRNTAKLAVRNNPPVIGLFAEGTHQIVECLDSPVHAPEINACLRVLSASLRRNRVQAYDETTGGGELRTVVARTSGRPHAVELSLVWNTWPGLGHPADVLRALCLRKCHSVLADLLAAAPETFYSVWAHFLEGSRDHNFVFSAAPDAWVRCHGPEFATEQMEGIDAPIRPLLHFVPGVFRQVNSRAFARIIRSIRLRLPSEIGTLVELYGGVGTIGLHLLDRIRGCYVCSDENPSNARCFQASVELLGHANTTYHSNSAAEMISQGIVASMQDIDVLIVNPPRKGLDKELNDYLIDTSSANLPSQIVYVSCGLKSLIRDLSILTASVWKISHVEGHLLFPGSDHIEIVLFLQRK